MTVSTQPANLLVQPYTVAVMTLVKISPVIRTSNYKPVKEAKEEIIGLDVIVRAYRRRRFAFFSLPPRGNIRMRVIRLCWWRKTAGAHPCIFHAWTGTRVEPPTSSKVAGYLKIRTRRRGFESTVVRSHFIRSQRR